MQQRFYASGSFPTTLAASIGATGNPQVNSITGLPSQRPYTVLIDWGLVTQEAISVTSAPTGSGPWTLPCTRGIDGTTAQAHAAGSIAVHGVTAQDFNQSAVFIDDLTGGPAWSYFSPQLGVTSANSSSALAVNTLTQVTAATNLTMTLPSPEAGALIVVERETASTGTVTVSGSIRGSASTITLVLPGESEMFLGTGSTWNPAAGHKTLSSLDNRYPQVFNVKSYGATGNGTTNDTVSIQAAITAAATGSTVYVPWTSSGYLCGALTLPPGVRLTFERGAKLVAPASLATSWITATTSVVHNGTAVIGGTFDASAITSTSSTSAIIDFQGVTSCPNTEIRGNRTINAPKHGIAISESTKTLGMKWITGNSVEEHGLLSTGFGIYADYIGNVLIDGNYVYTAGVDDSIELGHSGPANITIDAHLRCVNNVVVGGQINYPFSQYAEIANNTVIGNTIQNDGNTADYVQIIGNRVFNATPASSFAGISHWGSYGQIIGNYIQVTTLNGIGGSWTNEQVCNNWISTTSSSNSGYGIYPGGGGAENTITGNHIEGNFSYGLYLPFALSTVAGNQFTTFNGLSVNGVNNTIITGNSFNVANSTMVGTPGTNTIITANSVAGPVFTGLSSKSSAYTIASLDGTILATGTTTITLPTAAGVTGVRYVVKNAGTGTITVATTSAQTIDGATTASLAPDQALEVTSDGSNWHALSGQLDFLGVFGDGSDGTVLMDGTNTFASFASKSGSTYTLTRDVFATSLTVNSGVTLNSANFRIYCAGAFANAGTVTAAGATATSSTGASAGSNGSFQGGAAGGTGNTGAGSAGTNQTGVLTGQAGGGGAGSGGAAGGGGTNSGPGQTVTYLLRNPVPYGCGTVRYLTLTYNIAGAPGGGGGSGDGTNHGGGGGAGGGIVGISAWSAVNTGTITAAGGAGFAPATGNCGGGGGGAGGVVIVYTLSAWTAGTATAAGGTGAAGIGTGTAGTTGNNGNVLNVVLA